MMSASLRTTRGRYPLRDVVQGKFISPFLDPRLSQICRIHTNVCSGFTFNSGYSIPWYSSAGGVCTQSTSLANTTITTTNTVTGYPRPSDIRAHVAWQVSWQFSDRSTLSPMPPTLSDECNNAQLPTWVPGTPSTLEDCQKPTYEHISSSYASFLWFVIIGIPLIAFAIILLCVWNCCRRKKKKKFAAISARQARERAAAQAGAGAKNYDTNVVAGSAGAGIELSETKKQVDSTQYMGHM